MNENETKSKKSKDNEVALKKGLIVGASIGIAIGAGVGAALGNVAYGVGIGVALGPAISMGYYNSKAKKES